VPQVLCRPSVLSPFAELTVSWRRTFTGLYFSYDADITCSLQAKHERNAESTVKHLPLWRTADRRFWFNSHVMQPFVQAGVSLPLSPCLPFQSRLTLSSFLLLLASLVHHRPSTRLRAANDRPSPSSAVQNAHLRSRPYLSRLNRPRFDHHLSAVDRARRPPISTTRYQRFRRNRQLRRDGVHRFLRPRWYSTRRLVRPGSR
jgi:hypothetical protein